MPNTERDSGTIKITMIEAMLMQLQLRWYVYQTIILTVTVHQRNVTAAQAAHVYPGLYIYIQRRSSDECQSL